MHLSVTGKTIKAQVEKENLPPNWQTSILSEASEKIVDCPHSTPKWSDNGFICLRTNHFMPGKLDLSSPQYVDEYTYKERIKRLEPKENDVLYSREGGILGVACRVPPRVKLCLGQRMMLIRPDKGKIRSQFLEMTLNSPAIKAIAEASTTGGAAPRVNMSVIKNYPISIPPLNEQDKIIENFDELMALCDRLKARLGEAGETRAHLAEAVVEKAVS